MRSTSTTSRTPWRPRSSPRGATRAGQTPEARRPAGPRASRLRHYGPTAAYSSSSTYHGLESRRSLGTRVIQVCEKSAPKEIFFTEVNSLAREGDMFGQRPHDVSRSQPLRNQDGRWSEARSLAACKKSAHFGRLYGAGTLFATIRRVNRLDHAEDVHMLRPRGPMLRHVYAISTYLQSLSRGGHYSSRENSPFRPNSVARFLSFACSPRPHCDCLTIKQHQAI